MFVEDFRSNTFVATEGELEDALRKRYRHNANEFWLAAGDSKFPTLQITVRWNRACLHYFPEDDHPGFQSSSGETSKPSNQAVTLFSNSEDEEQQVWDDSLVSFDTALRAAKEFLALQRMPTALSWREL